MPLTSPRLWIVATPLGNPEDLSPRAAAILASADLVLAEDTRRTLRLFAQRGLPARKLTSFHEHNEEQRQAQVLKTLEAGSSVALVSDAGTPLIADPGYRLVRACRAHGFDVSPVPGPSAPVAALSAAGLPPLPFTFFGFLPRGTKGRREIFEKFRFIPGSIVFFERKDRLEETLALANDILGKRNVAICRELTKEHEEFITGRLADYRELAHDLLGEITVIIGPPEENERMSPELVYEIFAKELANGLKPRKAAAKVQPECPGWSVADIYALALKHSMDD